jgi:hypothetical protein
MRRFFPPRPWKNKASEVLEYRDALLARFRPGAFEVKEQATASALLAEELIASFDKALSGMAPTDAGRKPLQDRIESLKAARDTAKSIEARWNAEFRPAEDAARYVRGALDLQVGKAGGLLAFNGLIIAVAVLLWTNRTLPAWFGALEAILLFTSSLLSLAAIWAWWGRADSYKSPQVDLTPSLQLAACRSWAGNLATVAAFMATVLIAIGVLVSRPPDSTRVTLDQPAREFRLPVTLDDTFRLRCEEIEGPPRPRGAVDADRLSCTLSR